MAKKKKSKRHGRKPTAKAKKAYVKLMKKSYNRLRNVLEKHNAIAPSGVAR